MISLTKLVYITLGLISLTLGIIGVFVPGLPTTPFILLSSWLFIRSSEKLYNWLVASPMGKYINSYHRNGGMSRNAKIGAIITMWLMIVISYTFFIPTMTLKLIVILGGIAGTICVAFVVPLAKVAKVEKITNESTFKLPKKNE